MSQLQSITPEIDIIIWLNGGKIENSFKYHITNIMTETAKHLKDSINGYVNDSNLSRSLKKTTRNSSQPLKILHIYTQKEMELNDYDIQYLKSNDILFISFDNSPFNPSNHYNQYQNIKCINTGGYGKIYLSRHLISKREYAIKQIDVSKFSTEELFNISREQILLQSLQNRNIIKWHDSFTYSNTFFTVMDYAKGGELTYLLKEKGRLSEKEAKTIFKQIQLAVKFIHNKNIIHRDLKPSNILFLDEERTQVVLIDFGISGFSNGKSKEIIHAGTLQYLAPEMASGTSFQSDPGLDLWAMGVILYQMVVGKFPFDGQSRNALVNNIIKGEVVFDPKIKLSCECKQLILGLLEKNRKRRIEINSELFENWYNNCNNNAKKVGTTGNRLYHSTNINDDKFKFLDSGKSLNAYLCPHKHNIRQHINEYLNLAVQDNKKLKVNNCKIKIKFSLSNLKNYGNNEMLPYIKNNEVNTSSASQTNILKQKDNKITNNNLKSKVNHTNISVSNRYKGNEYVKKNNSNIFLYSGSSVLARNTNPRRERLKNSIIKLNKNYMSYDKFNNRLSNSTSLNNSFRYEKKKSD